MTTGASLVSWAHTDDVWASTAVPEEALAKLGPIGKRPPLGEYIRELWRYRSFIWADARAKSLSTHRGTVLGNVWLIVRPMLDASVFFVMFGMLMQTSRGIPNFLCYLIIGVTMFPPLQRSFSGGGSVITGGKNLIRSFAFPRAALPISFTIRSMIDLLPSFGTVLILVMLIPPHAMPNWRWLVTIPILVLQFFFSLGIAFFTARTQTLIPDLRNIWPFLTQFWYFGSGVFFSYTRFIDHPLVLKMMDWNPGYAILTMYRDCLIYQTFPPARLWLILALWAFGGTIINFVFFWRKEESYAVER